MSRSSWSAVVLIAAILGLPGCNSGSKSAISDAARNEYGEKMGKIKEQIDGFASEGDAKLKAVLEDTGLSREQKNAKVAGQMDEMLSKLDSYGEQVRQIQPPDDLRPLHKFFADDIATNRALYKDFIDAFRANDSEKLKELADRADKYEQERKNLLQIAYRDAGLEPGGSLSSLKTALATRKLGTGAGFWGSLLEGLGLFLRWETWVTVILYGLCVLGSRMLVGLGMVAAEDKLSENSSCTAGCLGMVFTTVAEMLAMGFCIAALLPVVAGTGGLAFGEAFALWKPVLTSGAIGLGIVVLLGMFSGGCLTEFPGGSHLIIGGTIATALVDNAKKQAGVASHGVDIPLLQMAGMLVVATILTYLLMLVLAALGFGIAKAAHKDEEEAMQSWTSTMGLAFVASCQWLPLLWYVRYMLNQG